MTKRIPRLILASASPARLALLNSAGIPAIAQPSHFDESSIQLQNPAELVQALALGKAKVIAQQYLDNSGMIQSMAAESITAQPSVEHLSRTTSEDINLHHELTLILGCDSVLEINGAIHGKPASPQEAWERWRLMRSQVGYLYTGHALIDLEHQKQLVKFQCTQVYFANLSDAEIEAYVATGEPLHCAGCFALDGRGGVFIEKIEGCHSNVIGLSLPLLRSMLKTLGVDVTRFWTMD